MNQADFLFYFRPISIRSEATIAVASIRVMVLESGRELLRRFAAARTKAHSVCNQEVYRHSEPAYYFGRWVSTSETTR